MPSPFLPRSPSRTTCRAVPSPRGDLPGHENPRTRRPCLKRGSCYCDDRQYDRYAATNRKWSEKWGRCLPGLGATPFFHIAAVHAARVLAIFPADIDGPLSPRSVTARLPSSVRSHKTHDLTLVLDIIPDPSLGSGSPALRISDLFPRDEYDKVNSEATIHPQGSRSLKQTADYVLHDLKPSQRTH